jgi:hypothetical protein
VRGVGAETLHILTREIGDIQSTSMPLLEKELLGSVLRFRLSPRSNRELELEMAGMENPPPTATAERVVKMDHVDPLQGDGRLVPFPITGTLTSIALHIAILPRHQISEVVTWVPVAALQEAVDQTIASRTWLQAPYGTMVPTIDPKLKLDSLPEWDGSHDSAIDYFWEVYQLANLMGWLPRALGFWLPTRLRKGSPVQLWFSTLPLAQQAEMRSHYLIYLQVLKDQYLGKKWCLKMNVKYEQQTFRQSGHEKESPQVFLGRRVRFTRLLTVTDDGGPDEVYQVMRTAPIAWSSILILENIKSVEALYERFNEHEDELVDVVAQNSSDVLTSHNLQSNLRRLGYGLNQPALQFPRRKREKRVHLTEAEEGAEEIAENGRDAIAAEEEDPTIKNVYQVLARRQRPPPKGGYPFKKNDHVTTKMGKEPPSPCKVCGSSRHWDKECPDWNIYLEKQRRGVLLISSGSASDEAELLYHSAFIVLMDECITTQCKILFP